MNDLGNSGEVFNLEYALKAGRPGWSEHQQFQQRAGSLQEALEIVLFRRPLACELARDLTFLWCEFRNYDPTVLNFARTGLNAKRGLFSTAKKPERR
jgi:hypothetical protein